MIRYGGVVNIVTLVYFTIALGLSIWLARRQGLGHNFPWICLIVLALCRLVQVGIDLAATQMFPPKTAANTSLESGVAIITQIGLTPLFMATSSLLNTTQRPKGRRMQWILLILHVPLLISLALIVAGSIDPDSRDGPSFAATESSKAGISLYCACFVVLVWATIVISSRLYLATPTETTILTTVVLSLPFFLVDIVYMMCFAFEPHDGSQRFNVIDGSVTLQLCMQVVMEFVIVALYLGLGFELPNKANRLKERAVEISDMDPDQVADMILWKIYQKLSGKDKLAE